jgi:hypothetical protein
MLLLTDIKIYSLYNGLLYLTTICLSCTGIILTVLMVSLLYNALLIVTAYDIQVYSILHSNLKIGLYLMLEFSLNVH